MLDKLAKMYTVLDECCDELVEFQTNGVLDGFDDELSVSNTVSRMVNCAHIMCTCFCMLL